MGLTEEQKQHFIENGWLKIEGAFTPEQAAPMLKDVEERLGVDLNDKSTWKQWRINLKPNRWVQASEFAPKAWEAICELSGGEQRLDPEGCFWSNGFIVNLGDSAYEGKPSPLEGLDQFHTDGQFFVHYLDSPEQGIFCVPLWTDIVPGGGPTALCSGTVGTVAKWLYDHPDGTNPDLLPRGHPRFNDPNGTNLDWSNQVARANGRFDLGTGKVGDVFLLHPFLVHSPTRNEKKLFRAITNSKTSLKEPNLLHRADGKYSILEQTIRSGLMQNGVTEEGLMNWHITAHREPFQPGLVGRIVPTKADVTPLDKFGLDTVASNVAPIVSVSSRISHTQQRGAEPKGGSRLLFGCRDSKTSSRNKPT
ncbi:unnamed protein product, partial [Fusarium graminearum]